jgi:hypothetical protein
LFGRPENFALGSLLAILVIIASGVVYICGFHEMRYMKIKKAAAKRIAAYYEDIAKSRALAGCYKTRYQCHSESLDRLKINSAKNLGASNINMLRDSSSPAAPQNDIFVDFFNSLLEVRRDIIEETIRRHRVFSISAYE